MTEKFPHLNESKPNMQRIIDTPVHLVDNEHLWQLSSHFEWIKEKFKTDSEIVAASDEILSKIDSIMNIGNTKISWEIMKAANDDNYTQTA